ncbi:tRNA (5-methylaminomethyl-2-thiouridine)(34)-methyltransferase MnmD [Martelella endophytica]|uniref:5-methylaminomethyl-2-thiouridine methyltransferase n=1 Tax=Martelella endophytica TaxID=1486262 RepID=A0A0D5LN67_MAREN|nr:tRNA (5-methylaminomethyl-2-thiouridine)(34)-methyltransferase MnmD [Martelella endophytica]AJY44758.1 5-methylaminomethyl-2-thiouridine methyltransferase [Martelella endophytica]
MQEKQALSWRDDDRPYSETFGDHFFSETDGRAECGHVFVGANRLAERWQDGGTFRIGELGFGTGLNFCETFRQWKELRTSGGRLEFFSFELFPMTAAEIARALRHWPEIARESDLLAAHWPDAPSGTISLELDEQTQLTVICGDALASLAALPLAFNAWYLDGFAPSRNPEMWSAPLMQAVFDHTVPGGTFGTYAAAGFVRRNLQTAGFVVERRPGFAGKREMLAGQRPCNKLVA